MINGISHVGICVTSLDRAIQFYELAFKMALVVRGSFSGRHYQAILGIEGAAGQAALLRKGSLELELFEFSHPRKLPGPIDRAVCEYGISHFCVEVTDIDVEYERLKLLGVRFHCAPITFEGVARATYGRDPDGNVFELLEHREKAGERTIA